jgi:hypothetical protein
MTELCRYLTVAALSEAIKFFVWMWQRDPMKDSSPAVEEGPQ